MDSRLLGVSHRHQVALDEEHLRLDGGGDERGDEAAGAGADYAMTADLSLRAEYLYVSLAGISGVASGVIIPGTPLMGQFSTGSVTNNIMRVGVNWKFGRSEAPSTTADQ